MIIDDAIQNMALSGPYSEGTETLQYLLLEYDAQG